MESASKIQTDTTLILRPAGHLPVWPEDCVVCGQSCLEMREISSRVVTKSGWHTYEFATGADLPVRVHQACWNRFRFPTPMWVHVAGLAFTSLLVGMGYLSKSPGGDVPVKSMVILGSAGAAMYLLMRAVMHSDYVKIIDKAPYYEFTFRDHDYAQKFAALNADGLKAAQESLRKGVGQGFLS